MADGRIIGDGTLHELLSGGWYFATETARILHAARDGGTPIENAPLLPEDGARCCGRTPSGRDALAARPRPRRAGHRGSGALRRRATRPLAGGVA